MSLKSQRKNIEKEQDFNSKPCKENEMRLSILCGILLNLTESEKQSRSLYSYRSPQPAKSIRSSRVWIQVSLKIVKWLKSTDVCSFHLSSFFRFIRHLCLHPSFPQCRNWLSFSFLKFTSLLTFSHILNCSSLPVLNFLSPSTGVCVFFNFGKYTSFLQTTLFMFKYNEFISAMF